MKFLALLYLFNGGAIINNLYKFIILLANLSLIYILLVLMNAPASGYESSIYLDTPITFWIIICLNYLVGFTSILLSLPKKDHQMWLLGFFELLFSSFLIISLYALRNYTFYFARVDPGTYIGMANDICIYGFIPPYNFYPFESIFISIISELTRIPIISISNYLPELFYICYLLYVYSWSKALINDIRFVSYSLLAATPIFFSGYVISIFHQTFSVLMIPLFLYSLQKMSDPRFKFISILILIIYPFFHPLTSIFIIAYLIILFTTERFISSPKLSFSMTLISLSIIAFLAWFINQYILLRSTSLILLRLFDVLDSPKTINYAASYADKLGVMTAMRSLLIMTTDEIIYIVLSLILTYLLIFKIRKSNYRVRFLPLIICFFLGNIFLITIFFASNIHVPDRLINLNVNMVFTPIFVGLILYIFSNNKKNLISGLVLISILLSWSLSMFSLYPDPSSMRPNDQTTLSEISGMNWLISQKDPDIETADILTPVHRYVDLLYGYVHTLDRINQYGRINLPNHFGLSTKNYFPMDKDRYLVISIYDKYAYLNIWQELNRFNINDFNRLDLCINTYKIYENGGFQTRLIRTIST
jgi:hypothetical protein